MSSTLDQVHSYLESVEDLVFSSLAGVAPDLPNVREAVHRLWADVTRYGPPQFPEIHLPGLGDFEIPPPPPPPPPPKSWWDHSADWVGEHPRTAAGIAVGAVGAGLLAGYGSVYMRRSARMRRAQALSANERRQVVVVLGGDTPLALPLILHLERQGYIVITSVATPEAVDEIEQRGHGYVRALVLDPTEPGTLPFFLRSLASTLSRRFPINSSGDPHASLSTSAYIQSVICLLTLPSPAISPSVAPLEHIQMSDTYMPFLVASHILPLQVLQALLPLLRTTPSRSRDYASNNREQKSIIVCVPATDARVGLPFAAAQSMSAAATLRGVEILRREIHIAALTDPSRSMKGIRVVVVDVGAVAAPMSSNAVEPYLDLHSSMRDWTASEVSTYEAAFTAAVEGAQYRVHRKPTHVAHFVSCLLSVVTGGRKGFKPIFGLKFGSLRNWIRGDRIAIGAGAGTYTVASYLPNLILDGLLNIPHLLISIRNALLPVPPRVGLPPPQVPHAKAPTVIEKAVSEESPLTSDQEGSHDNESVEAGSEADVESNAGDTSGVGESWINLHEKSMVESQTTSPA
ncbi:hypothetical protein JAAARDRAFT_55627 [Jaapia argillacea MUCL 33604]|uniref:DUF1776-domain-containing protein n=1 Tax=Jaapia argillacea MUCL 33604 TaxID=933084 RepID=A0A067Q428_9AGAM|nr:hypothetical protein JAAARDRAFT_55627 [Jaapia argillacea MUCL 33604]